MPHPRAELREIISSLKAALRELKSWGINDLSLPLLPAAPLPSPSSPPGIQAAGPEPAFSLLSSSEQTRELFPEIAPVSAADSPPPRFGSLAEVQEYLNNCQRCQLSQHRNRLVFGTGNPEAEILLVGEGPGREEDLQGEPFVGRAGKLLDKILASINLSRREVYIANIVKCRPPENREPWPEEVNTCWPFLVAQILLINPRITVALGSPAARTLLSSKQPISKIRGNFLPFRLPRRGQPDWQGWLLPTYHPAFLLRNPMKKREVWEDMKSLREEYLHPGSQTAAPGRK